MKRCVLGLACALALLAGCSGRPAGEVGMPSRSFDPNEVVVAAGDTVTWRNDSAEVHTVTARQESIPEGAEYFASGEASSEEGALEDPAAGFIQPGQTFEVTFDVPGTYEYYCIPHESSGMTGTVVVEE